MTSAVETTVLWSARVRHVSAHETRVYARTNSLSVGSQASLRDRDDHPSAVELLLGAIGADLIHGFVDQARRAGCEVEAIEVSLGACMNNPLVHLGVIGEEGSAALDRIDGTMYVSAEMDEDGARRLWAVVLERSPLYQTLTRAARVSIDLRLT